MDADGAQADKDEVDFLEDLYALLRAAHFSVLSAEEWQSACNHDFTVRIPSPNPNPLLSQEDFQPANDLGHASASRCSKSPQESPGVLCTHIVRSMFAKKLAASFQIDWWRLLRFSKTEQLIGTQGIKLAS